MVFSPPWGMVRVTYLSALSVSGHSAVGTPLVEPTMALVAPGTSSATVLHLVVWFSCH